MREPPFIIQGQAAKREPPAVPIGPADSWDAPCPVKGCNASVYIDGAGRPEPDCDHEYPGKCDACDTVVGDRYEELTWMGDAGWLCDRCNSYCEECEAEGVITFCGVCATCLAVVINGQRVWPPAPVLHLCLDGNATWTRLD
jgi:hypothetical protein